MGSKNTKEGQVEKKEQPAQEKKPKPQPSEASKNRAPKQANQDQNQWMYDFILQYLASPMWRNPISDFLDENCIVFDEEEENKISYQDIHKQFKGMIEAMIEQLMADIGVEDEEQLRGVIEIGLRNKRHKKYFEQLLIVDNFLVFKKLMLKRNKELEYEALKELQKQEGGNNPDVQYQLAQVELDKERMEMEHAIAMSLAVDKEKKKLCIEEDEELQEAIRQSEMLFQSQQVAKQIQDNEQNKDQQKPVVKIEKIEQPNIGQAESVIVFEEDMAEQEPSISKQPQTQVVQNSQAVQQKEEPKKEVVQQVQQPVQQQEPKKEEPKKEEPKKAPLKPLPQIVQEKKVVTQADKEEMIKQMEQLKKEKQQIDQEFEKNLTEKQQTETVEERKKRLLEQREMLRKKKQLEREKELEKYNQDQGKKNYDQQQPIIEDSVNKDPLSSNMSEFIADQQKAQQLQQKKEELKKKAELMKKIRQQAQEEQQQ